MADPVIIEAVGKRPDEKRDYAINWANECFNFWTAATEFDAAICVRPTVANGFEYQSSGGQSNGKREPKWPTVLAQTITDGSITWTCVALSLAGLVKTITSSTFTPETSDLTIVSQSFISTPATQATTVLIGDGLDGETLDALNHVVFSGGVELDAILRVTISNEDD